MNSTLEMQIEAVLFYRTEPVKFTELAEFFAVPLDEILLAINELSKTLSSHSIRVAITDTTAQLVTAPEVSELIENMRKEELRGEIGKAGAETLAIIMYKGPLSRVEIDRIRGVNSTFIIRNLLIRGLVERRPHPTDTRSYMYAITPALLNHLGIQSRESLPEFATIMNALDAFEKQEAEEIAQEANPPVSE
jgi:segregation and condensation protein B